LTKIGNTTILKDTDSLEILFFSVWQKAHLDGWK